MHISDYTIINYVGIINELFSKNCFAKLEGNITFVNHLTPTVWGVASVAPRTLKILIRR